MKGMCVKKGWGNTEEKIQVNKNIVKITGKLILKFVRSQFKVCGN